MAEKAYVQINLPNFVTVAIMTLVIFGLFMFGRMWYMTGSMPLPDAVSSQTGGQPATTKAAPAGVLQ